MMSTWKTWVGFVFVCALFIAMALVGVDHRSGNPTTVGFALFGVLVIGGLWFSRYW